MKPYKTLLILLVFLVFLFGPSLFLDGPLRISSGLSIDFPEPPAHLKALLIAEDTTSVPEPYIVTDTIFQDIKPLDTALLDISVIPNGSPLKLEFADSSIHWRSVLDSIKGGSGSIRIMYYGDSQLEGDRITDLLRTRLRSFIGGTGPGLLSPTMLVPYTRTSYIRSSQNWLRYSYLSTRSGEIDHKALGPMLSISRFTAPGDTLFDVRKAWIRITPSIYADSLSSTYNRVRLFYGNLSDTLVITLKMRDRWISTDTLLPVSGVAEYSKNLKGSPDLRIEFIGRSSPDLYGISVESESGVVLDNIPSRGSAGLEFSLVERTNLVQLYQYLKPDLIIIHYGLNVVLNESTNYTYYENGITKQILFLKEILPNTEFLLIGLTDMARSDGDEIHSYPNIPLIIEAQRNAARRSGAMFWDSREAMGGVDAIVKWKTSDPPLASDDYTHLSYEGGQVLAQKLYDSMVSLNTDTDSIAIDTIDLKTVVDSVYYADNELDIITENDQTRSAILLSSLIGFDQSTPLIFTNLSFWIFLLILLIGYSVIFNKPLLRNSYLFLLSLFFYYKTGGLFFTLLLLSTLTDYFTGLLIYSSSKKFWKKTFLIISLMVNLGMLAYFKYSEFLTTAINDLFNTSFPVNNWLALFSNRNLGTSFDITTIILPVGISFFTFQTISYTIDVFRGKTKPVKNILDFGFYVSFFPQLVAGPIVRASEFIPQLYAKFSLTKREWSHALFLILNGLIKKIVISDYISVNLVDRVFAFPELYSGFENLMAVYGYGLQIYCDFSGYTDIAIGVALMLGYRLPLNFNSPYKAESITDFWRRWHISLSRWLKDYLYISIGGNRRGKFRTNINLMITMLLGGLWHGAAWKFVIWGGLHGSALVIHKLWMKLWNSEGSRSKFWKIVSIFITFNFVSFCWIFFRAGSMHEVKFLIGQILLSFSPGSWSDLLTGYSQVLTVVVAGYILHFLPVGVKESYRGLFIRMPLIIKMVIVYLLAIAMFNFQSVDLQPFIYFRF
jgi:D-alanyl-lipoteichoic acid acyltransferase DltB (MBOAT superfamily)